MYKEDAQSEYFTVMSFEQNEHFNTGDISAELSRFMMNPPPNKTHPEYENTLSTTKMSVIHKNNDADTDSCIGQFEDIVEGLPQQNKEKIFSIENKAQQDLGEILQEGNGKLLEKSKWLNDMEVSCIIDYQGKTAETVCRLNGTQLIFVNGGCRFKLGKITKMKILYENYQKCIWFTYEDELKFKIHIENDSNDDLYLLLSKILVQKLTLLEYEIDMDETVNENVDRFIMEGEIMKKSQFIGRWDLRKMVITDRIQSYRDQVCTFQVTNIREIWTRFEVYKQCLILKLRHGIWKTELAIPIVNFNNKFGMQNWLYRIYRLVSASSI